MKDESNSLEFLIRFIYRNYTDLFLKQLQDLNIIRSKNKMDSVTALAMWVDMNISIKQQRIILQHMRAFFGSSMTVPKKEIRLLSSNKYLEPETKSTYINGIKVWSWHRDPHARILMYLESQKVDFLRDKNVEVVVGADKGKKKVRALIKILIRAQDISVVKKHVLKVCHIDSESDSYNTIIQTIGNFYLIISFNLLIIYFTKIGPALNLSLKIIKRQL